MSITPGVITSPNHPADYPDNLEMTRHISVKKGKILRLEFTAFAVWVCGDIETCSCDFVKITDGDGTTLMDKICGYSDEKPSHNLYFQPPIITSKTNKVEIYFHTNRKKARSGWSLRWTAVVEGECYHHGCVRGRNSWVLGDKFCEEFFTKFGEEFCELRKFSPKLVKNSVNHQKW